MAGRPRLYADAAEKTRAYRERLEQRVVKKDRVTLENLEADLERLRQAIYTAQERGDPLALSLHTVTWSDLVQTLAVYFETGVISDRSTRAHRAKKVK